MTEAARLAEIRKHVAQVAAMAGTEAERVQGHVTFLLRQIDARDAEIARLQQEIGRLRTENEKEQQTIKALCRYIDNPAEAPAQPNADDVLGQPRSEWAAVNIAREQAQQATDKLIENLKQLLPSADDVERALVEKPDG